MASDRVTFNIRARKGQIAFWTAAASLAGLNLSAWLKDVATAEAARILRESDEKYTNGKHSGEYPTVKGAKIVDD
jgi:uncharacterized protein (DUF1778 family)